MKLGVAFGFLETLFVIAGIVGFVLTGGWAFFILPFLPPAVTTLYLLLAGRVLWKIEEASQGTAPADYLSH